MGMGGSGKDVGDGIGAAADVGRCILLSIVAETARAAGVAFCLLCAACRASAAEALDFLDAVWGATTGAAATADGARPSCCVLAFFTRSELSSSIAICLSASDASTSKRAPTCCLYVVHLRIQSLCSLASVFGAVEVIHTQRSHATLECCQIGPAIYRTMLTQNTPTLLCVQHVPAAQRRVVLLEHRLDLARRNLALR